jgi:hypothetical protein
MHEITTVHGVLQVGVVVGRCIDRREGAECIGCFAPRLGLLST